MATLYTHNCDSYTNIGAALNGQTGGSPSATWSGAAVFITQTASADNPEGSGVGVEIKWTATNDQNINTGTLADREDGTQVIYFRPSQTNKRNRILFRDGATLGFEFYYMDDAKIKGKNATTEFATYSANVWGYVTTVWRSSDGKYMCYFNGSTTMTWETPNNAWTAIDNLSLNTENPSGIFLCDLFAETSYSPTTSTPVVLDAITHGINL